MHLSSVVPFVLGLSDLASAYPASQLDGPPLLPWWFPPASTDSRSPCPGLNTLANHGYINRDGRDISEKSIYNGFLWAFGMNNSAVVRNDPSRDKIYADRGQAPGFPPAYHTCFYTTGKHCSAEKTLVNLTLLAEPHALEHDHSLSRQDYKPLWANGDAADNNDFNATIFQQVLDLIGNRTHVDFALANEIRLMRTKDSVCNDEPGWLESENIIKPLQSFELGFIFAVMSDPTLPDAEKNPQVRKDWWHYWFANERLPTALGWSAPSPPREIEWVASVADAIYHANPSATPSPLPSGALGPASDVVELPDNPQIPILPVPTEAPYAAQIWPPPSGGWKN